MNSTAAKAGTGLGDTYTFTGSASYVVSPTFLVDAYLGVTTIAVNCEPDRLDENLGSDYLGIPGTNGADRLYGGWPHFTITNYSQHRRTPAAAIRRTSTTTGRCSTPPTPPGRKGTPHPEIRRRHRPPGAEPPRARRRFRQLHVRWRADADSGRPGGEPVQYLRGVPARAADRGLEERHPLREQLHAKPQLAVQLLRQGPVAADAQADGVARPALRPLPDGHAHHARPRALRLSTPTRC